MNRKVKLRKYMNILVLGLSILMGGILLTSCASTFFGGPASPWVRNKVAKTIQDIYSKQGLKGKLSIKRVEHNGFSQGGIRVIYSYSEEVNGKQITLSQEMEGFDDDGHRSISDSSFNDYVFQLMNESSLQQPFYYEKTKAIESVLKKYTTNKMGLKDNKPVEAEIIDSSFKVEKGDSSHEWLNNQIKHNRASQDKNKQVFKGYYAVPPEQALAVGAVSFRLDFVYKVSGKSKDLTYLDGQKELNDLISKIDLTQFPDAKYTIGFDVQDEEGTTWSISNLKYIEVENGKIIAQSRYGEDTLIEYWNKNNDHK